MSGLRNGWVESEERGQWWPTDKGELITFVVPCALPGYVIQHAGKTYASLSEAEKAARDTYRVITYGLPREETP